MPILAVDQFGRLYETSPDRDDGLGYKSHARPVTTGDLTLGSAYLKSQATYNQTVMKERDALLRQDQQDRLEAKRAHDQRMKVMRREMIQNTMGQDETVKRNQLEKALSQGYSCGCKSALSGNPLTANGQSGYQGLDRTQKALIHRTTGLGEDVTYKVDPVELYQRQMEAQAQLILTKNARAEAKRVQAEADANAKFSSMRKPSQKQPQAAQLIAKHPLMLLAVKRR